ncbi:MAG: M20/M25/M40 family metallo-hydrolase, partial [Planctomycetota bacterium]
RVAGSAAHAAARARLVSACERLGLETEVQSTTVTVARARTVATVHNVVARRDGLADRGAEDRHAICVMAHYDSVAAGPGIGDDLAGVAAILEAARALEARGGLQRDLILLFTDAEEQGLLGAQAFAEQHPFADEVGVVVNVEGRGANGPSRMFETGPGNGWSVEALGDVARAPSATSVSAEIYRRMPNGTDFTVWIERGVPGLNYAFIGDIHAYHTPLDGLSRLSAGSLQHHVDNVVDAVTALDRTPFPEAGAATSDAVFLDLPTGNLVHASPRSVRLASGLVLLLAVLSAAFTASRRGVRSVVGGVAAALAVLVALPLAAHATRAGLGALGLDALVHPAYATPITVAVCAAAVAASLGLARLLARFGASGLSTLVGAGLVLSLGAFALSQTVLGATYLLLAPAAAFAFLGPFAARSRFADGAAGLVGIAAALLASVVWAPLHLALVDALGCRIGGLLAAPLAVGFLALLPALVAGRGVALGWMSGLTGLVALGASGLVLYLPSTTIVEPGRFSIVRSEDDVRGEWLLGAAEPLRERYAEALGLDLDAHASEPLAGTGPIFTVERAMTTDGAVLCRLRVVPRAGATTLWLRGSEGARFTHGGHDLGASFRWVAPPAGGAEVDVALPAGADIVAIDAVPGLGGPFADAAEPLVEARGNELVPFGRGDHSRVRRTLDHAAVLDALPRTSDAGPSVSGTSLDR